MRWARRKTWFPLPQSHKDPIRDNGSFNSPFYLTEIRKELYKINIFERNRSPMIALNSCPPTNSTFQSFLLCFPLILSITITRERLTKVLSIYNWRPDQPEVKQGQYNIVKYKDKHNRIMNERHLFFVKLYGVKIVIVMQRKNWKVRWEVGLVFLLSAAFSSLPTLHTRQIRHIIRYTSGICAEIFGCNPCKAGLKPRHFWNYNPKMFHLKQKF